MPVEGIAISAVITFLLFWIRYGGDGPDQGIGFRGGPRQLVNPLSLTLVAIAAAVAAIALKEGKIAIATVFSALTLLAIGLRITILSKRR